MNETRRTPTAPAEGGSPSPGPSAELSFEGALQRLTEIVQALEKGDLPLEQSLSLFEQGVKLSRTSQAKLDAAQKKVEQLLGVDDQGRTRTAPFETTNDGDDEVPF